MTAPEPRFPWIALLAPAIPVPARFRRLTGTCAGCGQPFARGRMARYCSRACILRAYRARRTPPP